jgi:hypothetical protein
VKNFSLLLLLLCMVSMVALAQNVTLAASVTSNLGNQPIGFPALTPFLLANNGSSTITITSITITSIAVSPPPFSIYSAALTFSCVVSELLPTGGSCGIVVQFKPSAVGPVSAMLRVTYYEGQNSDNPVSLTANLIANGIYDATLIALPNFPCTNLTNNIQCTVTLLNQEPTTLESISISVGPKQSYSITGNTCGSSLSALSSCTITVGYEYISSEYAEGVLQVTSNAPDNRTITFNLLGCRRYGC